MNHVLALVQVLKKHAIYDGYEKDSPPVEFLWQALTLAPSS